MKVLILLAYINKNFENIRKIDAKLYHHPLLLTLVNSVNKPDADLKLFFKELEIIAAQVPNQRIFTQAIDDLVNEFSKNPVFKFEENEKVILDIERLKKDNLQGCFELCF